MAGFAATTYVSMLLGLITGPLAARALGPNGRGVVAAVSVFALLLAGLLTLGVDAAVVARAATNPEQRPQLLGAVLRLTAAITPVAAAAGVAISYSPILPIHNDQRGAILVVFLFVPVTVMLSGVQAFFIADGALGTLAVIRLIAIGGTAIGTVALFLVHDLTVVSYLLLAVATSSIQLTYALRRLGVQPRRGLPLGPFLRFGSRNFLAVLLTSFNVNLDQTLIVPFINASQLGFYSVAVSLISLPLSVGQAIATRAFGDLFRRDTTPAEQDARAASWIRLTFLVTAVGTAGVLIVSPLLLPLLYGARFRPVLIPLALLAPGTVALAIAQTTSTILYSRYRPWSITFALLVGLVVSVVSLPLFLPRFGIAAASVISSVTYAVVALITLRQLRGAGVDDLRPRRGDVRELWEVLRH